MDKLLLNFTKVCFISQYYFNTYTSSNLKYFALSILYQNKGENTRYCLVQALVVEKSTVIGLIETCFFSQR